MEHAKRWDVLGLGALAVDDLLYVDAYPGPDSKVRVRHRERQAGGLTGTALVAASRFGARCAYGGRLGSCELSRYVHDALTAEEVDMTPATVDPSGCPAHSTIVVDTTHKTRTIFSSVAETGIGPAPDAPSEDDIRNARVLLIDHHGVEGTLRAARLARAWGVPTVADFERWAAPPFDSLFSLVDHLILSARFAHELTGRDTPEAAAEALWNDQREVIVITHGDRGAWWLSRETPRIARHVPAFPVVVEDTTGCGDVFHGVYAAGLALGLPLDQRVRTASAAAALKAMRRGGQSGIPTRQETERLLASG